MARPDFAVVGGAPPEEYPRELWDPDLTRDFFTMFHQDEWFAGKLHLRASVAVQGAALNMIFASKKRTPVGSLPHDEEDIASLIRVRWDVWEGLKREPLNQMHGWREYLFGDELVYGNPDVIRMAKAALTAREERALSSEAKAISMRRSRLVETMRESGVSSETLANAEIIEWLDNWLLENHQGPRRKPQILVSIQRSLHAAQMAGVFRH
ncbi:hypothetical protein J4E08_22255 [Sagittula sp. NFXS13]|uniref:hypothetical protein n=1 Tax=Sagittula sp. NFXS13 TaxID=2819095 RepID=UPI0032DF59FB